MINLFRNIFSFILNIIKYNLNFNFVAGVIVGSKISNKTKISSPCHIQNSNLGDYSYIASNSYINNTQIGKFCSIGINFSCGLGIHPLNGVSTSPMFYSNKKQNGFSMTDNLKTIESNKVTIGNDVFIGANVTILDGVNVGNGVVIGACSFVNKDIPDYAIVGGSPAKVLRYRFNEDIIRKFLIIKWWDWDYSSLSKVENFFFEVDNFIEKYERK